MITFQGTAGSWHVYPSENGYIRSVQVDLGDATLHADGKREGPVKQLDCPVNKLVLLLPSDPDAV